MCGIRYHQVRRRACVNPNTHAGGADCAAPKSETKKTACYNGCFGKSSKVYKSSFVVKRGMGNGGWGMGDGEWGMGDGGRGWFSKEMEHQISCSVISPLQNFCSNIFCLLFDDADVSDIL